MHYVNTPF